MKHILIVIFILYCNIFQIEASLRYQAARLPSHGIKINNLRHICCNNHSIIYDYRSDSSYTAPKFTNYQTFVTNINNNGYAIGYLSSTSTPYHVISFRWNYESGDFELGPFGICPIAINNFNLVLGKTCGKPTKGLNEHTCIMDWDSGQFSILKSTKPKDLNDFGDILDSETETKIKRHLNTELIELNQINNNGSVVGNIVDSGALIFENDLCYFLPTPTYPAKVQAIDINNSGKVIGSYLPPNSKNRKGCLWDNGKFIDLASTIENFEDVEILLPMQINDYGDILTTAYLDNEWCCLLLTLL